MTDARDDDGPELSARAALGRLKIKLKTLRREPVNDGARAYNAALDEVEKFVATLLPPPVVVEAPPAREETYRPELQEEWDTKILAWAERFDGSITLDKAIQTLAPHAKGGSAVRRAIEAALKRLPRDRFTISWYMSGDHLAPSWSRQESPSKAPSTLKAEVLGEPRPPRPKK